MADALNEIVSGVPSSTDKNKNNDTLNSISIGIVIEAIEAVQALPDMDEDLVLDACDFLENEKNAKLFIALNDKLRRKWLMRKLRTQMRIFVNLLTGNKLSLDVLSSETIADVKIKIQVKEGTRAKQQRLIFAGRKLEDDRTLADCGIRSGSELHMVLCLCGC